MRVEAVPTRIQTAVNGVLALPREAVVQELVDRVGLKLTALIGGVSETRRVHEWIAGREPRREDALRAALQAVRAVSERYDNDAARAWLRSTNMGLNMRSPIAELREARQLRDYNRVVKCAVQDIS
jgi:hypothetical protein